MSAEESIAWALERFNGELRFAISFQKTSSVIIDMVQRVHPRARFFYVDTGLLFPETYETRDALAERYGLEFERIADLPPVHRRRTGAAPTAKSSSCARPSTG